MEEIIKVDKNEITAKEEKSDVSNKVLHIEEDSLDIDYSSILNRILQCINIGAVAQHIQKGVEYVVQIPGEFQKGFDAGQYFIMENSKTGKLWPTLMQVSENGRNQIVTPLPVKPQEFFQGNPFQDISLNLQSMFMQKQITELIDLVGQTLNTVKMIEGGQLDNRVGLLNSGKQQILLALSQQDEETRKQALLFGMNNISVAQGQIAENFIRRVEAFKALPKSSIMQFFMSFVHDEYLIKRDDEYQQIQEYYNLYLRSTKLLAASYAVMGDIGNAEKVFDIAIEKMQGIDFSSLKTIEYSHKGKQLERIYEYAVDYISTEKQECLDDIKQYDYITIDISGEKLLEVIENGGSKEVPESETR